MAQPSDGQALGAGTARVGEQAARARVPEQQGVGVPGQHPSAALSLPSLQRGAATGGQHGYFFGSTPYVGSGSAADAPAGASGNQNMARAATVGAGPTRARSRPRGMSLTGTGSAADFPVLPAPAAVQGQRTQTDQQVAAILSLPPTVLAKLARTQDLAQQQQIASTSRLDPYLPVMALPAPSPGIQMPLPPEQPQTPGGSLSHPGIPHILHQVFAPNTAGLLAPSSEPARQHEFLPTYRSVDDWAIEVAQRTAASASLDAASTQGIASQLKQWALHSQEAQVEQHVVEARVNAVNLAAQAEAALQTARTSGGTAYPSSLSFDISPYAATYRDQLAQIASGYYTRLHKDAMRKLRASEGALQPSTTAASPLAPAEKATAMNVQAAAVAALTANVMAATELANRAGEKLNTLGMPVAGPLTSSVPPPGPAAIEATKQTLGMVPSQQQYQHQQKSVVGGPSPTDGYAAQYVQQQQQASALGAPQSAAQMQKQEQVNRLLLNAEASGQCSEEGRNFLLSYAHTVYSKNSHDEGLLPLLHTLAKVHPGHLPTLLLLSCVYYSAGQYELSVHYNEEILRIDPEYVEAMSNVGTTKRAMGLWKEAEEWWWRAIKLRPTYFDAFDNLLGVLCNPNPPKGTASPTAQAGPRYAEALQLCDLVESRLFGPPDHIQRPLRLPASVPPNHVHRLQNLFYAKGNLRVAQGESVAARDEYEKALEVVLSPPARRSHAAAGRAPVAETSYSLVDVVLATVSLGYFMMAANAAGYVDSPPVWEALAATGLWDGSPAKREEAIRAPLELARQRRSIVSERLLKLGGGILPCILLLPADLEKLSSLVFNMSLGVLPALVDLAGPVHEPPATRLAPLQAAMQTTSTVLLTLAKCFQDVIPSPSATGAALDRIPPSSSLLLPLYYLALTLHPSPSTCNNLGILLSTIPATMSVSTPQGAHVYNGQLLAHQFYMQGLAKDASHPHLYTNLGSLLKDMGRLAEAVTMYEKAVECNPNFDVALANLANAIKDMGRVQDSVQWYMRAVQLNPNFPEAVCGLVNALGGVCDWHDRGAVGNEPVVDPEGNLLGPPVAAADGKQRAGWMGKVSRLVDKQLDDGAAYGHGVMRLTSTLDGWLDVIAEAFTASPKGFVPAQRDLWRSRLRPFFDSSPTPYKLNEGGFLIRVVERALRRIQRRCYLSTYGQVVSTVQQQPSLLTQPEVLRGFPRIPLPSSLSTPPVPTVLPFHTFTYPLTPRECRLISHRNALRISLSTLNQPWVPSHIYPPPPPPCDKLNIGYISSDFNNHPLAHLMQSVFGMHNLSRYNIFCYATTPSDGSPFRRKIESEAQHFIDVSQWSNDRVINQTLSDGIHILVNLNGYTKGARNEIFAARPCPVQAEFMGFAGTIASGFTDWIIADPVVCPPEMVCGEKWRTDKSAGKHPTDLEGDLDPEELAEDWVYTEKFIYMPHSYFVCDHKQGFRDEAAEPGADGLPAPIPRALVSPEAAWPEEEPKRWSMRKALFPALPDNYIIFANFNQLYKASSPCPQILVIGADISNQIDPLIFKVWLDILKAVPNSILWLLRFPAPGEPHLKATAERWAGPEVASRVVFTDVAPKHIHIQRGRVADLFLDSTECNAHTTAADILWTGTPILTLPRSTHKHKMCSRVAASIALATGFGPQMIVNEVEAYQERAVSLASTSRYLPATGHVTGPNGVTATVNFMRGEGELASLRKQLFLTRERSPLFDTARWTRNLEQGYEEAWRRFVQGTDSEDTPEWQAAPAALKQSCSIWVQDSDEADDLGASRHRSSFVTAQRLTGGEIVS